MNQPVMLSDNVRIILFLVPVMMVTTVRFSIYVKAFPFPVLAQYLPEIAGGHLGQLERPVEILLTPTVMNQIPVMVSENVRIILFLVPVMMVTSVRFSINVKAFPFPVLAQYFSELVLGGATLALAFLVMMVMHVETPMSVMVSEIVLVVHVLLVPVMMVTTVRFPIVVKAFPLPVLAVSLPELVGGTLSLALLVMTVMGMNVQVSVLQENVFLLP